MGVELKGSAMVAEKETNDTVVIIAPRLEK